LPDMLDAQLCVVEALAGGMAAGRRPMRSPSLHSAHDLTVLRMQYGPMHLGHAAYVMRLDWC
jgi:hypothetical protein